MKVLIVSSYPRVDWLRYKQRILEGLVERQHEVKIVYSGTRVHDYVQEARRRNLTSSTLLRRGREGKTLTGNGEAGPTLHELADRLGVEAVGFASLGSVDALGFVERFDPEHGINLSGLYIPTRLIHLVGGRIVGGHYGDLPRFRGRDTVRWPILLDHPTVVSHMYLAKEYDMGDILLKSEVRVSPGQHLEEIRRACQEKSAHGHLAVIDAFANGRLAPRSQEESEGTTFYQMGSYLRERVDELLEAGRYESGIGSDS